MMPSEILYKVTVQLTDTIRAIYPFQKEVADTVHFCFLYQSDFPTFVIHLKKIYAHATITFLQKCDSHMRLDIEVRAKVDLSTQPLLHAARCLCYAVDGLPQL